MKRAHLIFIVLLLFVFLCANKCDVEVKIYPNPAKEYINIEKIEAFNKVEIYDINGILKISVDNPSNPIYIHELNAGVYFVKAYAEKVIGQNKFIKN